MQKMWEMNREERKIKTTDFQGQSLPDACVCACVRVCVCIYIYIYTHTHTICICIPIFRQGEKSPSLPHYCAQSVVQSSKHSLVSISSQVILAGAVGTLSIFPHFSGASLSTAAQ